jgi:CheY-like chemotaxis protein
MESIGTLAGGIAHDFNNILAAILGNVALARHDDADRSALQSHLGQIQQAAMRARSLVQQILAFSRRDPGLLIEQPLRPVLEETLALLRATLPAAVRVEAVLPSGPVGVRADATQLQQVLMNLATNAWHALPERGGRIEIGAERLSADRSPVPGQVAPGPLAHLWVRDNGSGMDEATLARIFDPFFTTKPVGQGTGLGLSVVHGIVRAHEGAITVDSAPGGGSTFHLYLPSPELPSEPTNAERGPGGEVMGGGRHVLYVDDDEVVVIMAERLLERAGYRVTVCAGAAQALELVRSQHFDAVVTDYNMPDQSGLDLARQLIALVPGLPVILSSGLVSEELREQAMQAGVKAVLRKERSVEELADAVARALAAGGAAPRIGR